MIISAKYGKKLIKEGKAEFADRVHDNNEFYIVINRIDKQRVDHFIDDRTNRHMRNGGKW